MRLTLKNLEAQDLYDTARFSLGLDKQDPLLEISLVSSLEKVSYQRNTRTTYRWRKVVLKHSCNDCITFLKHLDRKMLGFMQYFLKHLIFISISTKAL